MFYFCIPYLPEILMKSNDFAFVAATFRGKRGGVKNRENLSRDDLDVFKHSLNTWGLYKANIIIIHVNLVSLNSFILLLTRHKRIWPQLYSS